MSAPGANCNDECINKLRDDIMRIVGQIGLTDPQQQANFQFANLDIMLNEMLQEAFTGNTRARSAFQAEMTRLQRHGMIAEEQASQYRERARLIEEIARRFQNPHLTLSQLRSAITNLDALILNDQWDEVDAALRSMGYHSGLGEEWETFKQYMKSRVAATKQMTVTAYNFVTNNAYPMLCWLMAFLCILPEPCFTCLKNALSLVGLEFLFDMIASPSACAYWKAKVAGFMYERGRNVSETDIENAMWALFGGLNNMSQICVDVCFQLLGAFNKIQSLAGGIFLNGISALSRKLNIANLPENLNIFDESQSMNSKQSRRTNTSTSSTKSFITATGEIDFDGVKAEIAEIMDRRSADGYGTVYSGEGSQEADIESDHGVDDDDEMEMDETDSVPLDFPVTSSQEELGVRKSISLANPAAESVLRTKRKIDRSTGGRKSRRYKKKRSTLKRRGLKRRRTRKGKKRRHTKKRR